MNGVFDLGGTDGLGPVVTEDDEPVFRAEWEKIAFSLFASCFRAGLFNIDSFRHGIEQMDPAEYLLSNYYEHWAHVAEHSGEKAGVIDPAELDRLTQFYLDNPDAPLPQREDPELLAFVDAAVTGGAPAARESDKVAVFSVGDTVTVAADSPTGHTRRARYVRGRTGVITGAHGTFIYPDSAGNGGPDAPEHLYTVRFTARELWGEETGDPNSVVYFDVWEPYLTLVTTETKE
ncbi:MULTISPECIES: nitrile hydratase subunit beta [Rhodococcus]|uniref:Nitrile hydratase subunit beta n=1 Tax=Rhodococcus opacus TaxID=37919 RepID=A0AAX3Y942_RHOOP|nr:MULTISPECIES: nitrile hydratase subunit beta [Rhodococcus]NHU46923.1 nitrile hydratase subunit beta [Rhodococcus sp. A14]MCZ4589786.1 nitrile hydratase subunit beta [Rhodococcus opacus]MDI9938636.1 nitrile hydratase subunit beta [Rhodococcus sp. IEGM 1351]MDJ0418622.1 nitrile hydratase subunit beta [Rhodococcus opacus]MDV6245747.1 nitrile hydratase subunit beta [Rhodococcus opacus]